jgi:hypothetical protein
MDIEALANKVAEYANTCCYRSDGFEESVLNVAREAITEAVAAEREACALKCEITSRHPSSLWEEAGCWKHSAQNCADAIRMRSNA